MSIPSLFAMRTTYEGPYLTAQEFPPPQRPSGILKFDETNIWSPHVKFAVQSSTTNDFSLVHIRCCYNNKYWVVRESEGQQWIVASADKPEEETNNPACTLFRVEPKPEGVQFFCISQSKPVRNVTGDMGGLQVSSSGETFSTFDCGNLVVLPKRVAFKSADTGKFLVSRTIEGWPYHKFESGLDFSDPLVAQELFPTNDGLYRIRDNHFGMYWRRSPNWIFANAGENDYSKDALFSLVKVSDSVVALRNLANNNFCGSLTTEGKTNCLNACYSTMVPETRLNVVARYFQSQISDIRYSLSNVRIYDEKILELQNTYADNEDPKNENKVIVKFSVNESRTTSWTNSISMNVGVSVTLKVSVVPLIEEGEIQMSASFGNTYEWGESKTITSVNEMNYEVQVPPLSKVKVTLMCTKAVCDVPFSYKQTDVLTDGSRITEFKDDGIFTGINSYNFYVKSMKE